MNRPQVFIEKIMPVKLLNQQVYYEHGGNPFKGLHRWYSRKPLSFSRASVLASLLPADISMEEFEYLLGLHPDKDGILVKKKEVIKLYKTPPTSRIIEKLEEYCDKVWGKRKPVVLDAFAGGGSIPFEAARYGLNVLASDLNPVAVVTMKAAMEYPLKFGADLQQDIDKWVKFVGDEAQDRLAEFFPSGVGANGGSHVQNYLWAHTVVCPHCESVVPLSPNWWVDRSPGAAKKGKWCAVKPIPNLRNKCVDFELVVGRKGKGTTIETDNGKYDPGNFKTVSRSVGKCPNCESTLEQDYLIHFAQNTGFGHQIYAVAYKEDNSSIKFRNPCNTDIDGYDKAIKAHQELFFNQDTQYLIPQEACSDNPQYMMAYRYGLITWDKYFNPRQLLTLVTYVKIIEETKYKLQMQYEPQKVEVICTYLSLIFDRCVDKNSRLTNYNAPYRKIERATFTHSLNLMWNYPELNGAITCWSFCAKSVSVNYEKICEYLGFKLDSLFASDSKTKGNFSCNSNLSTRYSNVQIDTLSADSLDHIQDCTVDIVVTDPPYYDTLPYADISDFFYVWMRRNLLDIFPELFYSETTDKDREAVANLGRFRNMGASPRELANQDYEAKMQLAFSEYYRVLRDDGVMTVQFNHKESGAWDVLTKSLIDAGFEITASWAVSTENPQNLHQAKKNSVSSTVLLVCRKRDPDAEQAWWDDLRPEVANLVEQRAPEFEENDITGIDLYLSAFGSALNVFSRSYPILDSSGEEVRPEVAFAEARKAIANYRFRKLVQTDTAGFDPLTQWYLLAWDAFKAREFPFDEARQLALAVGGFDVNDLSKTYKLLAAKSGSCTILTPKQRHKKRAFTVDTQNFDPAYLIDGLHAIMAIYEEEQNPQLVRNFLKNTGLINQEMLMKTIEIAFKVMPKNTDEHKTLTSIWLSMDEIKEKVVYEQTKLSL